MQKDGKPVECFEDGSDVVELSHSHQDTSRDVLSVLELKKKKKNALTNDPDEFQ